MRDRYAPGTQQRHLSERLAHDVLDLRADLRIVNAVDRDRDSFAHAAPVLGASDAPYALVLVVRSARRIVSTSISPESDRPANSTSGIDAPCRPDGSRSRSIAKSRDAATTTSGFSARSASSAGPAPLHGITAKRRSRSADSHRRICSASRVTRKTSGE